LRIFQNSDDEAEYKGLNPPATSTHLTDFFCLYPKFEYDPSRPTSKQFRQLGKMYKEDRDGGKIDPHKMYEGYNRALGLAFAHYYGSDVDDLGTWQRLCRAVEISPVPDSLEECKFVSRFTRFLYLQ
jgi:hypothetical protein